MKAPTIDIDQLVKMLLTGEHSDIVKHHAGPLKAMVNLAVLFDVVEGNWEIYLQAIVEYTEKHGKTPDTKGLIDYILRGWSPFYQKAVNTSLELDKNLEDVETFEETDVAALISDVINQVNVVALEAICQNACLIASKHGWPQQGLAMKRDELGLEPAQEYFRRGCSKLVGNLESANGLWHENTDAIVETLNERAPGAIINTGLRGMDDEWNLKLGKTLLVAGTSGDGKTTLTLTLLYNFALQGHNVVLFTLEDPQLDVWVKLAFIHTSRFKDEFQLPSLFEWEQRMAWEDAGTHKSQWLTPEEKANMRDVICSIRNRDKVPGLIDVQALGEWSKMKAYTQAKMAENKYSVMAVDYFGERMETLGDPRWRDKEINAAAGDAINFAQENNILLVAPVQVKKNLRDAYAAEYVDDISKNSGFIAPYDDIAAVKADQIQALPQGADYCIGVWSGNELKKKNQGLICCMKFRPTVQFPCFRFQMDKNSKYIRDAGRIAKAVESSIVLSTTKYDLSQEL
ncbi:MAG TPA: ATPase domain-containing protein [Terriglobales bacterium]|nr:ATPase domain-containing protein [Terriglobales bacterium]